MIVALYRVLDKDPFIFVAKQTDSGYWWWVDTLTRNFSPMCNGKTRPRLDRSEHYVLTKDFESIESLLDRQIADWKNSMLSDFYLMDDAHDYIRQLRERNRQVFLQHYQNPDGTLIYLRTTLSKYDQSWRQEIGILSDTVHRRSWSDNMDGSENLMRIPRNDAKPIPIERAREIASRIFDERFTEYKDRFIRFCTTNEVGE